MSCFLQQAISIKPRSIFINRITINTVSDKPDDSAYEKIESALFSRNLINSLCLGGNFALVVLGYDSCDPCGMLYSIPIPSHFPVRKCFVERQSDKNNTLLAQAFFITGFPTSYIIDDQYNILGVIKGFNEFINVLEAIVIDGEDYCNVHIEGFANENILVGLSYVLKSLLSYIEEDSLEIRNNTLKSLSYGTYFFNNYMLYEYYYKYR